MTKTIYLPDGDAESALHIFNFSGQEEGERGNQSSDWYLLNLNIQMIIENLPNDFIGW